MSEDNRIHVRVQPDLTPVRLEDRRLDINEEIEVRVESRLSPLGIAGVIVLVLAVASIVCGALLFALGYPEDWYARYDPGGAEYEDSRDLIQSVVLFLSGGVIGLFFGTSMFFYGRTVLGSGGLDRFTLQEPLEGGPTDG